MILGFKKTFPWGQPTYFKEKILLGLPGYTIEPPIWQPKLHTIRAGNRFQPGDILHMANGVRTKQYDQFNKGIPELEKVISVQGIRIFSDLKEVWIEVNPIDRNVFPGGFREMLPSEVDELAAYDGFESSDQFWRWFTTDLSGQIVHWTNKFY